MAAVLQYYPRGYQHCAYAMRAGEHATIMGIVTSNKSVGNAKYGATVHLALDVDPDALRELDMDAKEPFCGEAASLCHCNGRKWRRRTGSSEMWLVQK